jgi:hypothetical protein
MPKSNEKLGPSLRHQWPGKEHARHVEIVTRAVNEPWAQGHRLRVRHVYVAVGGSRGDILGSFRRDHLSRRT